MVPTRISFFKQNNKLGVKSEQNILSSSLDSAINRSMGWFHEVGSQLPPHSVCQQQNLSKKSEKLEYFVRFVFVLRELHSPFHFLLQICHVMIIKELQDQCCCCCCSRSIIYLPRSFFLCTSYIIWQPMIRSSSSSSSWSIAYNLLHSCFPLHKLHDITTTRGSFNPQFACLSWYKICCTSVLATTQCYVC